MKRTLFISVFALVGLFFSACDYVSNVVETSNNQGTPDDTAVVYRKVLIEDFTGHKCLNCPNAARELHRIDSAYHGKIVPIAIHAGTFANTNPQYPDDYRTPEGNTLNTTFGFNAYPNGLISRKDYGTPTFIKGYDTWETSSYQLMSELADFKIDIVNTFNSGTSKLTCEVNVKALNDLTGIYNLCVFLTEDSIIGNQLDGSTQVPNYVFMHVLRGSLNSTPTAWGEEIWNGAVTKNQTTTKTYSNFTVSGTFIPKNCHVVAYVYNNDNASASYYEVKQVEIKEITE
ncbi:MAG: Omp28 family outer membrane lipoprotein [Bacteroidota bacterium]|nr:Omp28 family outer membrane lipoprotein [Bacteroidota bacterium]